MSTHERFITVTYDELVLETGGDGLKICEAREQVAAALAADIRAGEIDPINVDAYADHAVRGVLEDVRERRRSSLRSVAQRVADILGGNTILGPDDDPLMRLAYGLGTKDGLDKALRHWTADDWQSATITRYRSAAESTAGAAKFDEAASAVRLLIGRRTTGEALGLA